MFIDMPSPATGSEGNMFFGRPPGHPSVNTYFALRGICVLMGWISIKLSQIFIM